jgi:DNA-binding NarL/FixJ family response regulator
MDVLIASGQPNLRFSLEVFLRQQPGILVTGTVSNTKSLLAMIHLDQPDLVVVDWALPGRLLEDVLAEVKAAEHAPHIIVLTKDTDRSHAALAAVADELLLQADDPAGLLAAIGRIRLGDHDVEEE